MAIATQTMTDDQRKSVVLEYFRRLDRGADVLDLFDEHAEVYFPKWGVARGVKQLPDLYRGLGTMFKAMSHWPAYLNVVVDGDMVAVEGLSAGVTSDGKAWRPDDADGYAGRWCEVFEVRNFLIERCSVYLDPDFAGADVERYPWLAATQGERG
jgi:ketosteroid isomerase-like protein